MSRLSLRARLVLGVLALAAVGLVSADAVIYRSISSFMVGRTDAALQADGVGASAFTHQGGPGGGGGFPPGPGGCGPQGGGPDFVELRALDGAVICQTPASRFTGTPATPGPKLPATFSLPARPDRRGERVTYLTVPALSGGGSWRVRAATTVGSPLTVVILATPFGSVTGTLHRLLVIELLVTGGVLGALALLGLWLVRLGLRPLTAIGRTADLISEGDLSHRVERAEPRTEVGRLGLALNTMLDRIEASDARLRRFVADASHELRTPLAAVRAYAELFERGAHRRPDDLARAMAGIGRESERMSLLVDDLLLLARLDAGRPLEREPLELDELAAEAVETARAVDPERRLALEAEPLLVAGDRVRLRQVLDNLLANVRAHTPAGTAASVRVRAEGGAAVVEVADEGPGLDAAESARVFERFYRPDEHRSRESGGAGLGLAIVAAIAKAHGGGVSVSSQPGAGASFRVTLPLASDAPPERPSSARAALHAQRGR